MLFGRYDALSICFTLPSNDNSEPLLVSHQLFTESKNKWHTLEAAWQDSMWAWRAKMGSSTKVCPRLGWRELKDALQISTLPLKGLSHQRLFIKLHKGLHLPLKAARRGPQTLVGSSSRIPPIPNPTVTVGRNLQPFKHIICVRLTVKHHQDTQTHSTLYTYCFILRCSVGRYERTKDNAILLDS